MCVQPQDYPSYPWTAHDMAGFVAETTKVKAATIVRPSLVTHWAFPILVLAGARLSVCVNVPPQQ